MMLRRISKYDHESACAEMNGLTRRAPATPPPHGVGARRGGAAKRRIPVYLLNALLSCRAFVYVMAISLTVIAIIDPAFAQGTGALTLDQCIEMALESNSRIVTASEKLNETSAAIDETASSRMPTVSATASYSIAPIPPPKIAVSGTIPNFGVVPGMDGTPTPVVTGYTPFSRTYRAGMHGFDIGVTATHVLYTGGRIQTAQRIAEHSHTATEWQRRSAMREVRRDVTKAYYQALSVNKSVMALDSAIALLEVTTNDMRNMVEVGMLGEHEVLLMEVELTNLQVTRQQAATGAQAARDYLSTLIGVPVNTSVTLVDELESPESFSMPELTSLQTRARDASTDLRALSEQMKIIEASLVITDATHVPTVVAQAGYSGGIRTNGDIPGADGKTPFLADWTNNGFLAVAAQWDIYSGGAVNHKRRQTLSQKRQLELTMENIRANLDMGVKTSAASLHDAYSSIEACRKSIAQAKRSYEISYDKFQEGMLASSELLRAHNSILQSEISYYNALSTFYERMADLDYLVNE